MQPVYNYTWSDESDTDQIPGQPLLARKNPRNPSSGNRDSQGRAEAEPIVGGPIAEGEIRRQTQTQGTPEENVAAGAIGGEQIVAAEAEPIVAGPIDEGEICGPIGVGAFGGGATGVRATGDIYTIIIYI